ncbi:Gfo/Idh/MocA family oxidoreductase [Algoriphagus boritolerans]|uniref:Tat (Twin-arginine translocation) pathway signal sequence n=1 Tax=Algoriphagus boritolerans DSM 17298 = JCM 18970 TaxID=1120964 RepID=A0A1H5SBV1_9BACT|nr:Gfo/Idh/MocA family oxidoreductase [Algoriphagus boritolerans]SEF47468.1 Tat (twin-arginine translocation) pathway signal sequence [Algoriphagus boritolerans DSM 17298 = JCM 18970]
MNKNLQFIDRRDFLKKSSLGAAGLFLAPSLLAQARANGKLRTAHIGLGGMGMEDLRAISSHELVEVVALCDVDTHALSNATALFPNAKTFVDYRELLREMKDDIDAVIVSTPDHTHAPASLMAMEMNKAVYCQKPLTHHVSEARAMRKMAEEKNLVTQMGIQVHSFYDYKLATLLIQSGIIGKVHTVRAWSPKNWGYDGPKPKGSDPIPTNLNWDLWLGTAKKRKFKEGVYHPGNWRKLLDYGCGTLGDMGVHIFDTPYNALQLDVPRTILNNCRKPTGFGFPENNVVTYEFPGTPYTAVTLKWVWYDGPGAPADHEDLLLPNGEELPDQGAMFMGEKGRLLLPHFQQLPRLIVNGKYEEFDVEPFKLGAPVKDYAGESKKHYHQFVDACLGKDECSAPFEYSARLTETILLGVIAGRFPNQTLNWDSEKALFAEKKANKYLGGKYRKF